MFFIGDSKTSSGPPNWVEYLIQDLRFASQPYQELRPRLAAPSMGCADYAPIISAELTTRVGNPAFVCINLGANDSAMIDAGQQEQWKADFATILDAVHTRWPAAHVYCAKMWSRLIMTELNEMDDVLIPAVLSTRPWAHVGIDERLILEGGDNGATYTLDGVHPNAAGNALIAAAWLQLLGY